MNRSAAFGAATVLAAVLLFGSVSLVFPFGRDQGNYAYPAWVWLDGAVLYRDVFVFKPPGTVLVHAGAQALFGHTMTAIRALDICCTGAAALTLSALGRRLTGSRAVGVLAGVLYSFLYGALGYWTMAQTDGWLNLPTAGALLVGGLGAEAAGAGRRGRGVLLLLSAGALVGVGMVLKYTAAAILAPLLLLVARDRRSLVGGGLALAVGAVMPLLGCAAWLMHSGAWGAFLDCQLHLVPAYVARTGRASGLGGLLKLVSGLTSSQTLRLVLLSAVAGLVAVGLRMRAPGRRRELAVVLAWLAAGAVSCVAQNKFFKYHYLMMLPAAALLGALALADVGPRLGRARLALGVTAAALLVGFSAYPSGWNTLARVAGGAETLSHHWSHTRAYRSTDSSVKDNLKLASYVSKTTKPGDTMFLWGFDPMVNFVAERKTVSRFLYDYPFAVSWGNPAYEAELLAALAATPPTLFVVSSSDATPRVTGNRADSAMLFQDFRALNTWVGAHYTREKRIARFDVYRLLP